MNQNNIINELKGLMKNYISETAANNFVSELSNDNTLNRSVPADLGQDNAALDYQLPKGIEYRLLIDRCITKCEAILPEEKFFNLMLELSRMIHAAGENDLSLELAQELVNKTEFNNDYDYLKAEAYLAISKVNWSQAYWDDCRYYAEEAMKIFNSISNQAGIAKCENMLGTLYGEKGEIRLASEHFEKALSYLTGTDDALSYSMILTNLGIISTIQGDYEKAIWNYKNSAQKFESINNTRCLSRTYHNIGMLYTRMEKYDAALDEFNKCITLSLDNNYLSNCAVAYIGKAFIYTKMKNAALADAYTDKAMEIAYRINDTLSIADIYKIKGIIQNDMENFQLSEEMFENSIRLNRDFENRLNEAESSIDMGKLLRSSHRDEESASYFQSAIEYFKGLKDKNLIAGLVEQYN